MTDAPEQIADHIDAPTPFGRMADAERSALLLAHNRGIKIQVYCTWVRPNKWITATRNPDFNEFRAYRRRPIQTGESP